MELSKAPPPSLPHSPCPLTLAALVCYLPSQKSIRSFISDTLVSRKSGLRQLHSSPKFCVSSHLWISISSQKIFFQNTSVSKMQLFFNISFLRVSVSIPYPKMNCGVKISFTAHLSKNTSSTHHVYIRSFIQAFIVSGFLFKILNILKEREPRWRHR